MTAPPAAAREVRRAALVERLVTSNAPFRDALDALRAAPTELTRWWACAEAAPDLALAPEQLDLLERVFALAALGCSVCEGLWPYPEQPPELTLDLGPEGVTLCKVGEAGPWPAQVLAPQEAGRRSVGPAEGLSGLGELAELAGAAFELEGEVEVTAWLGQGPVQITRWFRVVDEVTDAAREQEVAAVRAAHPGSEFEVGDDVGVPQELESSLLAWVLLAELRRGRPLRHCPPDEEAALEAVLVEEAAHVGCSVADVVAGLGRRLYCHTTHDYDVRLELLVVEDEIRRVRVVEAVAEAPGQGQALAHEMGVAVGTRVGFARGVLTSDGACAVVARAIRSWSDAQALPDDDETPQSVTSRLLPCTPELAKALLRRYRSTHAIAMVAGPTGQARYFDDYDLGVAFDALAPEVQLARLLMTVQRVCADVPGIGPFVDELLDRERPPPAPEHSVYRHFSDTEDYPRHYLVLFLGDLVARRDGHALPSRHWVQDSLSSGVVTRWWVEDG